jgi:hypothetical protein
MDIICFSDMELEEAIMREKYSGTVFSQEIIKLLIPDAGLGPLCKLKKMMVAYQSKTISNIFMFIFR